MHQRARNCSCNWAASLLGSLMLPSLGMAGRQKQPSHRSPYPAQAPGRSWELLLRETPTSFPQTPTEKEHRPLHPGPEDVSLHQRLPPLYRDPVLAQKPARGCHGPILQIGHNGSSMQSGCPPQVRPCQLGAPHAQSLQLQPLSLPRLPLLSHPTPFLPASLPLPFSLYSHITHLHTHSHAALVSPAVTHRYAHTPRERACSHLHSRAREAFQGQQGPSLFSPALPRATVTLQHSSHPLAWQVSKRHCSH